MTSIKKKGHGYDQNSTESSLVLVMVIARMVQRGTLLDGDPVIIPVRENRQGPPRRFMGALTRAVVSHWEEYTMSMRV
ncbi:MAG: hypothetical protein JXD19_07975 [Deltaproteobacteria bacterium]|nr:hypothetical protein [Deltaproteobacteria bacterium]